MDYEAIAVAQMRAACSDEGTGGGVFRCWVTFTKTDPREFAQIEYKL